MLCPGRHGSMSSSELESIIRRNSDFLAVRRAGHGEGNSGLYEAVSGKFILGIGGGRIPEYSFYKNEAPSLVRGWRNILYELLHRCRIRVTDEVRSLLGDYVVNQVKDHGPQRAPGMTPEPSMRKHGDSWV